MRILFLSSWFPYPPNNGSKIRIYNLLRGLSTQHEITLLAFHRGEEVLKYLPTLQEVCQRVDVLLWREFNPNSLKSFLGYFSLRPRSIIDKFSPTMKRMVREEVESNHYDLVIASERSMLPYLDNMEGIPTLLEDVELASAYDAWLHADSKLLKLRRGLTWWKLRHFIAQNLHRLSACTVVSEREREILTYISPQFHPIDVIPNCLDLNDYAGYESQPRPGRLIFTGAMSYSSNYEAVAYFMDQIWPYIKQSSPEVQFWVTGDTNGVSLPVGSGDPQVRFTGYVEDVKPLIADSWASVVPLLSGAGTRLKIIEAFALGTPVVSTTKGAEGLYVQSEEHLLIADTPESFANQVIRLLCDSQLRSLLVENARKLVREKYDWAIVMPKVLRLVEQISQL